MSHPWHLAWARRIVCNFLPYFSKIHFNIILPSIPRPCVIFRDMLFFFGEELLTPQARETPLIGCPLQFIQYFRCYSPYLEAVSSIHNLRMRRVVMTGKHMTWFNQDSPVFIISLCSFLSLRPTYLQAYYRGTSWLISRFPDLLIMKHLWHWDILTEPSETASRRCKQKHSTQNWKPWFRIFLEHKVVIQLSKTFLSLMGSRILTSCHWLLSWASPIKFTSAQLISLKPNFTTASRTALGPTKPPIQRVLGVPSLGVKRPGREADHSPPSSAEVKECVELHLHSPNTSSWCGA
jgi:hypothetical protein